HHDVHGFVGASNADDIEGRFPELAQLSERIGHPSAVTIGQSQGARRFAVFGLPQKDHDLALFSGFESHTPLERGTRIESPSRKIRKRASLESGRIAHTPPRPQELTTVAGVSPLRER